MRVDFLVKTPDGEQEFAFRNYLASHSFAWDREKDATAIIRLHLPSVTATAEFSGEEGIRDFIRMLAGDGECTMDPEVFSEAAPALRRLGIGWIALRTSIKNAAEILVSFDNEPLTVPKSVIIPGKAATNAPLRVGALYGPF